jgi:hypothetical protein
MNATTKFFNIKKGRKTTTVQASSFKAIDDYCKQNGYSFWVLVGMQSIEQLEFNKKNAPIVA